MCGVCSIVAYQRQAFVVHYTEALGYWDTDDAKHIINARALEDVRPQDIRFGSYLWPFPF